MWPATASASAKPSVLEVCGTKRRSSNVLTSGSSGGDEDATFGIRDCPSVLGLVKKQLDG